MAALCAAAECRVTAKKRKKKESTAVKLKAVSTNVGLTNKHSLTYRHITTFFFTIKGVAEIYHGIA